MPISSHHHHPHPLSPGPGTHYSAFCLYGFGRPGHSIYMGSHTMWPLVTGFSHPESRV